MTTIKKTFIIEEKDNSDVKVRFAEARHGIFVKTGTKFTRGGWPIAEISHEITKDGALLRDASTCSWLYEFFYNLLSMIGLVNKELVRIELDTPYGHLTKRYLVDKTDYDAFELDTRILPYSVEITTHDKLADPVIFNDGSVHVIKLSHKLISREAFVKETNTLLFDRMDAEYSEQLRKEFERKDEALEINTAQKELRNINDRFARYLEAHPEELDRLRESGSEHAVSTPIAIQGRERAASSMSEGSTIESPSSTRSSHTDVVATYIAAQSDLAHSY